MLYEADCEESAQLRGRLSRAVGFWAQWVTVLGGALGQSGGSSPVYAVSGT